MSDWTWEYVPDAASVVGGLTRAQIDQVEGLAARYAGTPEAIILANKLPAQTESLAPDQLVLVPTDSADILKEIRLSPVEMDLLRDSRSQLEGNDAAKR